MRTRTRGKILLRNCARRSKVSKPLMSEGVGELKWACPLCSDIGKFVLSYIIKPSGRIRTCVSGGSQQKRPMGAFK